MAAGPMTDEEGNRLVLEHLWMGENLAKGKARGRLDPDDALQTVALAMVEAARQPRCRPEVSRRYMVGAAMKHLGRARFPEGRLAYTPDYLIVHVARFFGLRGRMAGTGHEPGFEEVFDRLPLPKLHPGSTKDPLNVPRFRDRLREAVEMLGYKQAADPGATPESAGETESPLEIAASRERTGLVREAISRLPEREGLAVAMFWGIGGEPRSLREIGDRLGCGRDAARTILHDGERELIKILRGMGLGGRDAL